MARISTVQVRSIRFVASMVGCVHQIVLAAAIGCLEALLKTAASEVMSLEWQGRALAGVSSVVGAGSIVASLGGMKLYEQSMHGSSVVVAGGGGTAGAETLVRF